jgi:16S rRNA (guanine527-N7)-methyltransferase
VSQRSRLDAGVAALGLELPDGGAERLLDYLALLHKWNRVYNLTAVREPAKMLTHHLLDCLAVLPYLRGDRVLDVGSGAGLPGIPLALARAEWSVTLLEANQKKSAFLAQAVSELGLGNANVECERVEQFSPAAPYDVVISRAFSDLPEFVRLAGRHCGSQGVLVAMKGIYPFEELREVPPQFALDQVVPLTIPGLNAERHLVLLRPAAH